MGIEIFLLFFAVQSTAKNNKNISNSYPFDTQEGMMFASIWIVRLLRGAYVVLLVAALLGGRAVPVQAATFVVDTIDDFNDVNLGDGVCGNGVHCSLRAAIQEANALGGSHTITLSTHTYGLSLPQNLVITANITINGTGSNNSIIADSLPRQYENFFLVQSGATLNLSNLEITGSKGALRVADNAAANLSYVQVYGNDTGSSVTVATIEVYGTLSLTDSLINSNNSTLGTVYLNGQGVYEGSGSIYRTTISANMTRNEVADHYGGGVYIYFGHLLMRDSTLNGNTSDFGGGIYNFRGDVVILRSTISSNVARVNGGGIYITHSATLGSFYLTNSTVHTNSAWDSGGGIYHNTGGNVILSNVTITQNIADADIDGTGDGGGFLTNSVGAYEVQMRNSVLAENYDLGTIPSKPDCAGTLVARYSLIGDATGCLLDFQSTPHYSGNPALGAFGNYSYPTAYRPPLQGSPLIDHGDPTGCKDHLGAILTEDQRGVYRNIGLCDIGSIESPYILRYTYLPITRK
jgi:CSLREA domain-containing protein